MKSIKIIQSSLILLFICICSSSIAQVQYEKTASAEDLANQRTKYEAEQLKLDAKEVESLGQINLLYVKQMQTLKKQNASQNNKSEVEALNRSHSQKIKSLLSSEKYQKYLALKEEDKKNESKQKDDKKGY